MDVMVRKLLPLQRKSPKQGKSGLHRLEKLIKIPPIVPKSWLWPCTNTQVSFGKFLFWQSPFHFGLRIYRQGFYPKVTPGLEATMATQALVAVILPFP